MGLIMARDKDENARDEELQTAPRKKIFVFGLE